MSAPSVKIDHAFPGNLLRFAKLLLGDESSALKVIAECAGRCRDTGGFRREGALEEWFVCRVRKRCLQIEAPAGEAQPGDFAGWLSGREEPMRSAVALFYLDLFPPARLCHLLGIKRERLADYLEQARARAQAGPA